MKLRNEKLNTSLTLTYPSKFRQLRPSVFDWGKKLKTSVVKFFFQSHGNFDVLISKKTGIVSVNQHHPNSPPNCCSNTGAKTKIYRTDNLKRNILAPGIILPPIFPGKSSYQNFFVTPGNLIRIWCARKPTSLVKLASIILTFFKNDHRFKTHSRLPIQKSALRVWAESRCDRVFHFDWLTFIRQTKKSRTQETSLKTLWSPTGGDDSGD